MQVKVIYHGIFEERAGIAHEFVTIERTKHAALISVMTELIHRHDHGDHLLFGTKETNLGTTLKIKINGKLAFAFAELVYDGDLIDICPVPEGEEYA